MPPRADDLDSIQNERRLIRVLIREDWLHKDEVTGISRPTSNFLLDSNFEASFFIEGEVSVEEVQGLFPGKRLAIIGATTLRDAGFWIERRPDEAPKGMSHPEAHVVVGPQSEIPRNQYTRACRQVVKSPTIEIIEAVLRREASDGFL